MKTDQNIRELSLSELKVTDGGFFFLILVAEVVITEAIVLAPIAGAFYKGWNDYEKK